MKLLIISAVLTFCVLVIAQELPESCRRRKCSRVENFENGITRGRRRVGRTTRFQCRPGYLLQGQAFLTCTCINGQAIWSNSFPICVNEGKLLLFLTI